MPLQENQPNIIQEKDLEPQGKKQKGTGFTNIGNILKANVGAGERMGSTIGGSIGMQAGQAKESARRTTGAFQQQVQQKTQEALDPTRRAMQLSSGVTPSTAIEAPGGGLETLQEEEAKKIAEGIKKATTGEAYTGPTRFGDYKNLLSQSQNVKQMGELGMGGGLSQRELLRGLTARQGPYTRGQSILDAMLLGQSEAGQKAIRSGAQEAISAGQNIARTAALADIMSTGARESVKGEAGKQLKDIIALRDKFTEAAKQQAADYGEGASRISQLATKQVQPGYKKDLEGKMVFDQQQFEKDQELINNVSEYGLTGLEQTAVDIGSPAFNNFLKGVFSVTSAPEGGSYFKGDQRKIAENLARIAGGSEQDIKTIQETPFEKQRFKGSLEDIMGKEGQYRGLYDATKTRRSQLESQQQSTLEALNAARKMWVGGTANAHWTSPTSNLDELYKNDPNAGYDAAMRGAFVNKAKEILGADVVDRIRNYRYGRSDYAGEAERNYLNDIRSLIEQKSFQAMHGLKNVSQQTVTLKDYLNSLITGQPPERSDLAPSVPGINVIRRPYGANIRGE